MDVIKHEHATDNRYEIVKFLSEAVEETIRAQSLFPSPNLCLAALVKEVGELAQAMLKVRAGKCPTDRIRQEAIQVAAMATRCALEGDPSFR